MEQLLLGAIFRMFEANHYKIEKAGIWSRFFARFLDVIFIFTIFSFFLIVVYILYPHINPFYNISNYKEHYKFYDYLMVILFLPFYIFIDAAISSSFGNNFGNKLLGIKIISNDGDKVSFSTYLKRNFIIYISCFTFGIPLIQTIALFINYSKYKKTSTTIWDVNSNTDVISCGSNKSRTTLCAILYFIILIIDYSSSGYIIKNNENKNNNLNYANNNLNYGLPKRIDEITILNSIVQSNNEIIYNYYLKKVDGEDVFISDENILNEMKKELTRKLSDRYCSGDLRTLKDLGYGITSIYREKGNNIALETHIDKYSCYN